MVPHVTVEGLISGLYHVYLRHASFNHIVIPNNTDVTFSVGYGLDKKNVGGTQPFNDDMKQLLQSHDGNLACTYVATLDLSDFPINTSIDVAVNVTNTAGDWKGNWLFEGAVFMPTTSLTSAPY